MKKFLKKLKSFIKRNSYALSVSACVVLAITLISVSAISLSNENKQVNDVTNTPTVPVVSETEVVFVSPIENGTVIKEYADDHLLEDKTSGYWQTHQAVDYACEVGTKVRAVYDGKVEKIEQSMMDGVVITISHSGGLKTVYRCLGEDTFVQEGDSVKTGQEIGTVTDSLLEKADGCHLHFELYKDDVLINPSQYFADSNK